MRAAVTGRAVGFRETLRGELTAKAHPGADQHNSGRECAVRLLRSKVEIVVGPLFGACVASPQRGSLLFQMLRLRIAA